MDYKLPAIIGSRKQEGFSAIPTQASEGTAEIGRPENAAQIGDGQGKNTTGDTTAASIEAPIMTRPAEVAGPDKNHPELGWLWKFCGDESVSPLTCQHPWTLTYEGAPHAVATNGHVLFIVPGDHGFAAADPNAFGPAIKSFPVSAPRPFPADQARERFGLAATIPDCDACQNTGRTKCRDCDGEGEKECTCKCGDWHAAQCEECDNGTVPCSCLHASGTSYDRRIVTIDGVPFKYEYVRRALACLPVGATTWQNDQPNKAAILRAGDFTAVVMPLREQDRRPEFALDIESTTAAGTGA